MKVSGADSCRIPLEIIGINHRTSQPTGEANIVESARVVGLGIIVAIASAPGKSPSVSGSRSSSDSD